jgi:hypothetical protein
MALISAKPIFSFKQKGRGGRPRWSTGWPKQTRPYIDVFVENLADEAHTRPGDVDAAFDELLVKQMATLVAAQVALLLDLKGARELGLVLFVSRFKRLDNVRLVRLVLADQRPSSPLTFFHFLLIFSSV